MRVILLSLMLAVTLPAFGEWITIPHAAILTGVDDTHGRIILDTPGTLAEDNPEMDLPGITAIVKVNDWVTTFGSWDGYYRQRPYLSNEVIFTEWNFRGVSFIQSIELPNGKSPGGPLLARASYRISNESNRSIRVGIELIETCQTIPDTPFFTLANGEQINHETVLESSQIPSQWYLGPLLKSRPTGIFIHPQASKPDWVVFTEKSRLNDSPWEFWPAPIYFSRINAFTGAVGLFYRQRLISPRQTFVISTLFNPVNTNHPAQPLPMVAIQKSSTSSTPVPNRSPMILPPTPTQASVSMKTFPAVTLPIVSTNIPSTNTLPAAQTPVILPETNTPQTITLVFIADNSNQALTGKDSAYVQPAATLIISGFSHNSAELKSRMLEPLNQLADRLRNSTNSESVLISGHTDDIDGTGGTQDSDIQISKKRANEVQNYLISRCGLSANRFQIESCGKTRPLGNNQTLEGRLQNRRVEIQVMSNQ